MGGVFETEFTLAIQVMSGSSYSFSFPVPPEIGFAAAQALANSDTWPLEQYVPGNLNCFQTRSKWNWIEYRVHLLVTELALSGLGYLSNCFTGMNTREDDFFAISLHAQKLSLANEQLSHLLGSIGPAQARTLRAFEDSNIADSEFALLNSRPSSIADAQARFDVIVYDDGDDIPSLIAFLQGHLVVLETALKSSMSVVYAARLC